MKYESLLKKKAADPAWAEQHRLRTLELQRKRFQNPEVRRRHAMACEAWRQKKALGITKRKPSAPHQPALLPEFREAPFLVEF